MTISVRGVFLGLILTASLTACSLPGYAAERAATPPTTRALSGATAPRNTTMHTAPPASTVRQKLQTLVDQTADFRAIGVDLSGVAAAMAQAKTLLRSDYGLPQFRSAPDFAGAFATLTDATVSATAEAVAIDAARVAAEAEAARVAAVNAAAAAARSTRAVQNPAVRVAPNVSTPSASSVYELRVVGVARNQADFDRCGLMDVTEWMGARELAAHWSCGRGFAIPRSADQLFVVTGAGTLNGTYISLGVVGTLNFTTQTTLDIPHIYDLIVSTCLNNDSTHMMILALRRTS